MGKILALVLTKKSKRAQMHLLDLVISISIFLIVLLFLYIQIEKNIAREKEKLSQLEANFVADSIVSALFYSYGYYSDWATKISDPSDESLRAIGTAESYLKIDKYKLEKLNQIYYNNYTKKKLGFRQFDGDINITFLNGTNLIYIGDYDGNKKVLAYRKVFGTYEDQIIILKVRVWEK